MPTTCIVVNCQSRSGRDKKIFYRLPRLIKHQGKVTETKSNKRRRLWLAAINRSDLTQKTLDQIRVCSDHFLCGKPAKLYDETNPDWVPSKNLGNGVAKSPSKSAVRSDRLQKRNKFKTVTEAALSLLELSASFATDAGVTDADPERDVAEDREEASDSEEMKLAKIEISELKDENRKLQEQNEYLRYIIHEKKASIYVK
ncbi:uncharacterized protein [Haliotis cracherodii]|uniref:uncharacterized protein n=1 Tax=Haliotis cracherodii TaxID=6455 RepID=UPI0039E9F006